jgi:hypothetical protein
MQRYLKHFNVASIVTIAITLALFIVALFAKGLTHDLLLEAGVFLVSVKLILAGYKSSVSARAIERELAEIKALLKAQGVKARAGQGAS